MVVFITPASSAGLFAAARVISPLLKKDHVMFYLADLTPEV